MKKLIYTWILGLFGLMILITSCNKKLEEYNPSGLTGSTVITKAAGFESVVNAAYSYTRWWYGKEEGNALSEMGTDIWTSGSGDVYPQITQFNNLQGANTDALNTEWNNFYAAINLCNTGIAGVSKVTDYTISQKAIREAELRFLRAFYYWHVVETWGGVNFSTLPTSGVVTTANLTPVDTIYNQIFADLKFAVANLPVTTTDYGRVTVPVAKAFLARMDLTRGKYAEACSLANDVIKNYGFALLPKFSDLWQMANIKNKEIVWAVDYSTNLANNDLKTNTYPYGHSRGSNSAHLLYLMVYDQVNTSVLIRDIPNGRPFNRYMPTKALLNLFDATIDSRYAGSFQDVWYANKASGTVKVGDTVCYCPKGNVATYSTKYTTYDFAKVYKPDGSFLQNKFYISLSKFKDPTRTSVAEAQSARDVFVIRLAEMYMIAAESKLNLNSLDSAAFFINQVRTRAALTGKTAQMQITPSQVTLDFILDERAREFCGEQIRWFDLKRTGKTISRINAMNPDAAKYVQTYHLLRPIPQTQLDAVTNKDVFKQNPGYN
jgi:starch-binding outer membrane protein, SusD/RagB family